MDEYNKRDWKLLPGPGRVSDHNSYLLIRQGSNLNFVMYEILHGPATRLGLVLVVVGLVLVGIPTMLVFFTCMIEQRLRDGFRRSLELLKADGLGRWCWHGSEPC